MITIYTLSYLASQKQKDATALLHANRNSGAIYLMGYALELSFKRKISQTLGFLLGFPESGPEYNGYNAQIAAFNAIGTGITITQLRQLKNHDLKQLIIFSGAEVRIKTSFLTEWLVIQDWNPENRYKIRKYSTAQAKEFLRSSRVILREIA